MQCCGDPFAVGQMVSWTTSPEVDQDYLGTVLGSESAAEITDYEDHHDVAEGLTVEMSGVVESIRAVSCRFAQRDRAMYPVEGTAVVETRTDANGWEPESDDVRFLGYVVTLAD